MLLKGKHKTLISLIMLALLVFWGSICQAVAQPFVKVPEKLQAALFIKILAMSKEISSGSDIAIHVVNDPMAAAELKKAVGRKIGKSTLIAVNESSEEIPVENPAALYIGNTSQFEKWLKYCRENNVLSFTGIPELVEKGVTLGVGAFDNKPKILLNAFASKQEKITWNPTLLKISKIYQ